MKNTLDVLYEDNHLLVINKPAGIATMGAESGETVHSLAAAYLKDKYHKPGKVFVGVVSRLDAMTSGVLVLARTSKAASRLVPQFGDSGQGKKASDVPRAVKVYLAAVEGPLTNDHGRWVDFVRKDDAAQRMRVVNETATGAQRAELEYCKLADADNVSLVAIRLLSGRKHQIRLQLAERGYPILGDRKYDSRHRFAAGVALHSWCLQITHPTRCRRCTWYADLPRSWKSLTGVMPSNHFIVAIVDDRFGLHLSDQHDQPQADDCEETK